MGAHPRLVDAAEREALMRDARDAVPLLIGLTVAEAAALAASRDLEFQVVDAPGSFTFDWRFRRVRVQTHDGIVREAHAG